MATAFQNPTRLYALLARDAPTGLVIRRGPARYVAFVAWDRENDTFQMGQWLAGRVYPRRCDLSPDGRHVLYFATKKTLGPRDGQQGRWTGISRAPSMRPIAAYSSADESGGGGVWLDDTTYSLVGAADALESSSDVHWDKKAVTRGVSPSRQNDAQFIRAAREGWEFVQELSVTFTPDERREYFGNKLRRGTAVELRKKIQGDWWLHQTCCFPNGAPETGGSTFDRYATVNESTGKRMDHHFWEWAEVDRDRLVWATDGCLYAAEVGPDGVRDRQLLCDFNDMKYSESEALA